jgi:hypothetical protein
MSGVKLDIAIWNYDRAPALRDGSVGLVAYGTKANREPLDAYLRHHFERGLSTRRLTIEGLFVPELMDT